MPRAKAPAPWVAAWKPPRIPRPKAATGRNAVRPAAPSIVNARCARAAAGPKSGMRCRAWMSPRPNMPRIFVVTGASAVVICPLIGAIAAVSFDLIGVSRLPALLPMLVNAAVVFDPRVLTAPDTDPVTLLTKDFSCPSRVFKLTSKLGRIWKFPLLKISLIPANFPLRPSMAPPPRFFSQSIFGGPRLKIASQILETFTRTVSNCEVIKLVAFSTLSLGNILSHAKSAAILVFSKNSSMVLELFQTWSRNNWNGFNPALYMDSAR